MARRGLNLHGDGARRLILRYRFKIRYFIRGIMQGNIGESTHMLPNVSATRTVKSRVLAFNQNA